MANIEKHPRSMIEEIDQADYSSVPTCARASHLVGRYTKGRERDHRGSLPGKEDRPKPVILRLENLQATPGNLERIRERIRTMNRQLADSEAPFRLRVI